jgi:hypothetical protein
MKLNLKNVFLLVGMFVFTFALAGAFSASKAEAATCTMASGTWDGVAGAGGAGTAVFSGCTGGGANFPAVGDTIQIPANIALQITGDATVAAVIVDDPAATGANGITVDTTKTLTVSGGVTFTANTGALNQTITLTGSGTLAVTGDITMTGSSGAGNQSITAAGAGVINAANITIAGGASTGATSITTATGTIQVNGATGISFSGTAANAQLGVSGAGALTLAGTTTTLGTGGTTTLVAASTTTFSGSGAQTVNTDTYGILVISGAGAKTVVAGGTVTVAGALTLTHSLDVGTGTIAVTGATTIATTKTLSISATGTATLAAVTGTLTGSITNAGTVTTSGTVTLGVGGTVTNSGTFTASGTFGTGAGIVVNTGTLNLGGATTDALNITTLTAGTAGTINYNLAAAQTIQAGTYYNLTLSGGSSAVKTIPSTTTIVHDLSIAASTVASLTNGGSSTANGLKLAGFYQNAGSWGGAASAATRTNATYFAGVVTGIVTVAVSHSGGSANQNSVTITSYPVTPVVAQSDVPVTVEVAPGVTETTDTPGCSGGNKYNTSTGKICNNTVVAEAKANTVANTIAKTVYNFGTKTLKNGSRGEAVMELQRFLNATLNLGLVVDGKLGPKTIKVIKQWQKDRGLVADGLIGAKTKAKMNAEAN